MGEKERKEHRARQGWENWQSPHLVNGRDGSRTWCVWFWSTCCKPPAACCLSQRVEQKLKWKHQHCYTKLEWCRKGGEWEGEWSRGRFGERVSTYTRNLAHWDERHIAQCTRAPTEGPLGADNMAHLRPATPTQRGWLFLLAQRCYLANGNPVYKLMSVYKQFFFD